ncbi:MAG: hypothetical protein WAZ18_01980 [Alphaproteobacteria bacterium]
MNQNPQTPFEYGRYFAKDLIKEVLKQVHNQGYATRPCDEDFTAKSERLVYVEHHDTRDFFAGYTTIINDPIHADDVKTYCLELSIFEAGKSIHMKVTAASLDRRMRTTSAFQDNSPSR